jgi:diguanylate cyclase (GGDEF)-like protein/putative nucleotidyltransferase with HDIG domain
VSEAFVFTSVLLFGAGAGTVTAALDGAIISLWLYRRRHPTYRILFNAAAPALSLWVSAQLFFVIFGGDSAAVASAPLRELLIPLAVFTASYFLLNSSLIAVAIALEQRLSALTVWRRDFLWLSLNFFSGASVAALLVAYARQAELLSALWIIVPLLVVSYLTYKTSMGRVDDANKHLSQLNRLHLSTIETLAMAIDAKDQITHGHIRRVQDYAVGLARKLGVTDEKQIRAIEAASLLHDMGKLAVPDYILNKPGPLSPAEYEKMKLHASVGADILSSIEFPYPVVPIVRHHHESWDGTGYPDGIRGSDIPIGARILSVVDCFDALTSDRPYRPRLSDSAALDIIMKRRGTMYDPFVVDMFVKVHVELARPEAAPAVTPLPGLSAITEAALPPVAAGTPSSRLDEIAASSEEMLALFEISRGLAGTLNIDDAAGVIARHLRRVVPSTFCVFYVYDAATDDLMVAHAAGDTTGIFTGLRIALGQRLAGWVAANRQTIVNSDPMLDLGETARALQPPLRSSISTPLMAGDTLVGVLSLYSSGRNAFTDDHRRIVEAVARQVSNVIRSSRDYERERAPALRDSLTGLPNVERLHQFAATLANADGKLEGQCSVLFIDVDGLKDVNRELGRAAGDRLLAGVVEAIRRALRGADFLFRFRSDEFVVYLAQTDFTTSVNIASRIKAAVRQGDLGKHAQGMAFSVSVGVSSLPQDGGTLDALIAEAKGRAMASKSGHPPSRLERDSIH